MKHINTLLRSLATMTMIAAAGHATAQVGDKASIQPVQPTVTEPQQPGHTVPDLRSTSAPRAPATTQEVDAAGELAPPPVQGIPDSIAETQPGQQATASLEQHYDHMQASAEERVGAFDVVDADGDLRVQWADIEQQQMNISRALFDQLDSDASGDLDRGEFVGVGETLSVNP